MIDVEERIRRAATLLDDEATRATDHLPRLAVPSIRRRSPLVPIAAGILTLAGFGGIYWLAVERNSADISSPPTTTATDPDTAATPTTTSSPVETLPPLDDLVDVPITVMGQGPTDWYRLQPDLDVAWYGDGTEDGSRLCFRTVEGQQCLSDDLYPSDSGGGPVAIRSTDTPSGQTQWLIVTVDPEPTVTVDFDNGMTASGDVERDTQSALGVARLEAATDATPVGVQLVFEPS